MELINDNLRVKVIIGTHKRGDNNITKPIKTIMIINSDVNEVYEKIIHILKEQKNGATNKEKS